MTVAGAVLAGGRDRQCRFPVLSAQCTGQSTTQKSTSSRAVTSAMRLQSLQRAQQRARRPRRLAGPGMGVGAAGSAGLLRPTSTHTKPGAERPGAEGWGQQHSLVPSNQTGSSSRRCAGILACS